MSHDSRRLDGHGLIARGPLVTFWLNGGPVEAHEGESLAAALFALDRRHLRAARFAGGPRGVYCGMGICYDCVVTVDGRPNVRACMLNVRAGMVVQLQGVT